MRCFLLYFGQIVKLTQDASIEFSDYSKTQINAWKKYYKVCHIEERYPPSTFGGPKRKYYTFCIPAGSLCFLKYAYIDARNQVFSLAVFNPKSESYSSNYGSISVRGDVFTDRITEQEKKSMELFQSDFILSKIQGTSLEKCKKLLQAQKENIIIP